MWTFVRDIFLYCQVLGQFTQPTRLVVHYFRMVANNMHAQVNPFYFTFHYTGTIWVNGRGGSVVVPVRDPIFFTSCDLMHGH